MKEQPNYYSIIPATVRYDDKLKANEKLLYGEITALANKNGYCWAENNYFAKLYDVHKITVSNWISNLEKQGYISIQLEYVKGTKQVSKRYIYLNDSPTPISEKANRYKSKDLQGISEKTNAPISEKTKEELNNTSTNITSINKDSRNSANAKYDDNSPYMKLAKRLFEHIKQRNPKQREPNWQTWSDDFRKTVELDNRGIAETTNVLDWCQQDDFWKNNVLSPGKLRIQYDQLFLKMNESPGSKKERNWEEWDFMK